MTLDPTQPPPTTGAPAPDDQGGTGDPAYREWLNASPDNLQHTRRLRNENASYRVRARAAEQRLASLDPDGANTVDLSAKDAELRTTRIENGLLRVSRNLGVEDVDLLHAYLQTTGKIRDLDPSEASFLDDLQVRIEETLEEKPALRGGRPTNIPPTTGAQIRPPAPTSQLSRADVARMAPEEIADAQRRGLLDQILGRRGGS